MVMSLLCNPTVSILNHQFSFLRGPKRNALFSLIAGEIISKEEWRSFPIEILSFFVVLSIPRFIELIKICVKLIFSKAFFFVPLIYIGTLVIVPVEKLNIGDLVLESRASISSFKMWKGKRRLKKTESISRNQEIFQNKKNSKTQYQRSWINSCSKYLSL